MAHCKVFVGSLPPGTKPKELRHLFQNFGIVIECDVMNRCGFIHMETPTMAETAILALHGSEFKGQTIVVEPGRPKDNDQKSIGAPIGVGNMICGPIEGIEGLDPTVFNDQANQGGMRGRGGFGQRRGMVNRGGMGGPNRGGMGYPPGMSNRGGMGPQGPFGRGGGMGNRGGGMGNRGNGMGNRGGGMGNRGGGMGNRGGGMGGNPFAGPSSEGFGNNARGGFRGRGGINGARDGGGDNRNQSDSGPIRNSPNFKSRPGPYSLMGGAGGPPNENPRGGSSQRGGPRGRGNFGGTNRTNTRFSDNTQQQSPHDSSWNRNKNDGQGGPNADFADGGFYRGNVGGGPGGNFRGKGNFMQQNAGQDRRGFTLADPPLQQEQNHFGNNRPMERQNSFRGNGMPTDGGGFQPRFNSNMRGGGSGPNQQRGRGGRGGFGGRGGRGGRGGFVGTDGQTNNYNQEFPALVPARGRGGFAGNRGGFNRNAPNMMPNQR